MPLLDTQAVDDLGWMQRARALALRGLGHVSPNPLVGCVVVSKSGDMLGEGWHERYGEAHAEPNALADARARGATDDDLRAATVYVTLEPCAHQGKTPPCADLLIQTGVRRVVVGMRDPFPAVDGKGIEKLRAADIEVTVGVDAQACWRMNEAFVYHVRTGRPLVTLKIAQTLDGYSATTSGDSKWITSEASRRHVHRLRAASDAVLVGSGTARADDPRLTVRHTTGPQPLRIVLDRTGDLPPSLHLFSDEHAASTVAIVAPDANPAYADALQSSGGRLLRIPTDGEHLDLSALLDALGRGDAGAPVHSLLVEGGPRLASALLRAPLADRLLTFIAPIWLGDGRPAFSGDAPNRMADAARWPETRWDTIGDDALLTAYRHTAPDWIADNQ